MQFEFLPQTEPERPSVRTPWSRSLARAIRDADELVDRLHLPESFRADAHAAAELFPLLVPEDYLERMTPGDPTDPLLRQVLPLGEEFASPEHFTTDALGEAEYQVAPGLLQKYAGRALLVTTGRCAVHCRYCFRRHYPYHEGPQGRREWTPALDWLAAHDDITEVLLSGGDPLMLTDVALFELLDSLDAIEHVSRLRIHTRLPIVLPDRVTDALCDKLRALRSQPVVVVHANHANEIRGNCREALRTLVRSGIPVLNQAVLLRGINDDVDAQFALCEALTNVGVLPYYLHALDRVTGTAHFEVAESEGERIVAALRSRLPGYAVPRLVREVPGEAFKRPLP